MMAAITAAREGAAVTIIEHNDRVGKKILSTGNGRCNYTNLKQDKTCYRCTEQSFPMKVIEKFDVIKTVKFFEDLGIVPKDRNGYLYPFSEQATAVLDVLRMEAERLGVGIVTGVHVQTVKVRNKGFHINGQDKNRKKYEADADCVIIAAGSKAASKLGSDGSGYEIVKKLGHRIIPVVPALVQLKCAEKIYHSMSGVRLYGKVSIEDENGDMISDTGEIQLTAYGISGIPVFQISRYAAVQLYRKNKVTVTLDFMPDLNYDQLKRMIKQRISLHPERKMEMFFTGLFNRKVSNELVKLSKISLSSKCGELTKEDIIHLCNNIKMFKTRIVETNPFEQAQICAGGVDTSEIDSSTMESKLVKGIYFAGEIVDVDGICGGYNLQWAWSSGYLAGKEAAHAQN